MGHQKLQNEKLPSIQRTNHLSFHRPSRSIKLCIWMHSSDGCMLRHQSIVFSSACLYWKSYIPKAQIIHTYHPINSVTWAKRHDIFIKLVILGRVARDWVAIAISSHFDRSELHCNWNQFCRDSRGFRIDLSQTTKKARIKLQCFRHFNVRRP